MHPVARGCSCPSSMDSPTTRSSAIKNAGTFVTLPADWSPIWEKTPADKAYILLSGEVSVRRDGKEIARLGPGEIFGEAGDRQPRAAHRLDREPDQAGAAPLHPATPCSSCARTVPAFREPLDRTVPQERLDGDGS